MKMSSGRGFSGLLLSVAAAGACSGSRPSPAPSPSPSAVVPFTRATMARTIDAMIGDPQFRRAAWGILIVDPETRDTLYSHRPAALLIPASNQKLVVSSTMLAQLGPDFRYRTTFAARGSISDGTLNGDLAVIGRGDPTTSDHMQGDALLPLRAIADSLWQRGVRRISGDVVAVGDAFPGPVAGSGWPWNGLDGSSYAGVDELLFNEGLSTVKVRAGQRVGDTATVETVPTKTFPATRVLAVTVPRNANAVAQAGGRAGAPGGVGGGGRGGRGNGPTRLSVHNDTGSTNVVVRGQIALGDSATLRVAQHDPDFAYVSALAEVLQDRGITVERRASTPSAPLDTLFTVASAPLSEILPKIMKPSQNQIAEVFLRTIGLEKGTSGTAEGGRAVIQEQFDAWQIQRDAYSIADGSGLSRSDLLSPEAIIGILEAMRTSPHFKVFYDALPIAGVDGTIGTRMRNTPAQGNLHAKTGTLQMVRSLSGYVTTADGHMLEFSILCNNWTTPQAAVDKVGDTIGASLAAMRLR